MFWKRDGTSFPIEYLSSPIMEGDRVTGAVVVFRDITARKQTEDTLKWMATIDELTCVANRRHFMENAETELKKVRRFVHPLSMLMLDIDHFKKVNDNYGHGAGDEVLKALAVTCRELIRNVDLIGRIGGDEFAIVLVETDLAGAGEIAERLRTAIENLSIEVKDERISFTISVGVAVWTDSDTSIENLMDRADSYLLKAKGWGRNRVVVEGQSEER